MNFFSFFFSDKSARSIGIHLRNIIVAAVLVLVTRVLHGKRLKSPRIASLLLSATICHVLSFGPHVQK